METGLSSADPQLKRDQVLARDVAERCFAGNLRMINRAVSTHYDKALRPHGIKASQLALLVAIADAEAGARPAVLSQSLRMDKSTLSRTVERMCSNEWVVHTCGDDARSHRLRITESGRELMRSAYPAWRAAQEHAEELLGMRDANAIHRLAKSLRRGRPSR